LKDSITSMLSSSSTPFQNSQVSHSLSYIYPLNKPIPGLLRNKVLQFHPQGLPHSISDLFPGNPKLCVLTSPSNHQIAETITYEPVKKVKPSPQPAKIIQEPDHIQTEKSTSHLVTLTVEEVFSRPAGASGQAKHAFFQEDEDEESVELSFLSSPESEDLQFEENDLNLNKPIEQEDSDCIVINPPASKKLESRLVQQPLVVQDQVFATYKPLLPTTYTHKNYTNDLNKYNPNILKQNVEFNFLNRLTDIVPVQQATIQPLYPNKPLTLDYFTTFQPLSANVYPQNLPKEFYFGSREPAKLTTFQDDVNKNSHGKRPNQWDGRNEGIITLSDSENDVDSNDTGSTSLGLESRNLSALETYLGEKIQKESSPYDGLYNTIFDDEKPQVKRGRGRPRKGEIVDKKDKKTNKPKPTESIKKNLVLKKEKSNNSASLNVNKNPLNQKANRGLNKLQLLRYQDSVIEEEEEVIKNFGISPFNDADTQEHESCDRERSISSEEVDDDVNALIDPEGHATLPPFNRENPNGRRRVLNPVWNPAVENQEELEVYLAQISEIIEFPVTNQEKAFKLLKSFNMNMESLLEVVKEDVPLYRELFRVKANKLRGCRINGRSVQF